MRLRTALALSALVTLSVLVTACFGTRHEARQVDAVSVILFTGEPAGCTATLVRDRDGATVWSGREISSGVRYRVTPGVYALTIKRGGRTVVRRQIFLGDQQDFEVRVPARS